MQLNRSHDHEASLRYHGGVGGWGLFQAPSSSGQGKLDSSECQMSHSQRVLRGMLQVLICTVHASIFSIFMENQMFLEMKRVRDAVNC